jgi:putative endopeptidase
MVRMIRRIAAAVLLLGAAAAAQAAPSKHAAAVAAWNRADMDTTCAPCRDFDRYANGGWLDRTKMPPGFGSYGAFDELGDRNELALRAILEHAQADAKAKTGTDAKRLGDYYSACLDSAAAERAGLDPVRTHLEGIDSLRSLGDVPAELAWLHANGIRAAFVFGASPDPRRSSLTIASAQQGGLGLPDREYYFRSDTASKALRAEYQAHIERMFRMIGRGDAAGDARRVLALETRLAQASMTNVQRRDPRATYHKVPLDSLKSWTRAFAWDAYFDRRSMPAPDSVNVQQPDFYRALASRLSDTPLADWRAYLRWHVLDDAAAYLSQAFVNEDFSFRRRLTGATELLPRWKRCIAATDGDLGDLLGRQYVREHFPPSARARALALVERLESALGDRIAALDWMGDSTRLAARVKLNAFAERIGYPDKWREYEDVIVSRKSWPDNHYSARRWEIQRQIVKIGGPVDKREWTMTTPTVNAFYSSSFNSINFPAGILQPPFFDPSWDDALNYGGIGAVIGHEMTHGFDDRGRQFDADGNLRDWWTPTDAGHYRERADRVATQFDGYVAVDTMHVNGRLTLGENIADLGGLAVAYAAFEKATAGRSHARIDGLTPEQRFFLSWARVWRTLETPEDLRSLASSNPHSPPHWRIVGPLSNLDEFAKAFGCAGGDAMVRKRETRARIW